MNPKLDVDDLAGKYRRTGRVHVPDFLDADCADSFFQSLKGRDDWRPIVNQDDKSFDLDRAAQSALSREQSDALETASFNALNIFAVPQPHSVSKVALFAPYRRYSVTGWLRGR